MKLTVLLILLGLLRVSASMNAQVYRINLELDDVACEKAIESVKGQTNLDFFFSNQELNVNRKVSVSCRNASLEEALRQILGEGYSFRIIDNTVVIRPVKNQLPQPKQVTVKGVVKDVKGNSLPGVTVLLKGTALGVSTDSDGKFTVSFPEMKDAILLFSFVGMKTTEVKYTGQTDIKVVLEEDAAEMEEVVVTGIFERKAESFTGSVATYKGEELKKIGTQNVLQSLKTLDPSFRITPNNQFGSDPNKLPDINIRGKSSISNIESEWGDDPNRPLFILDGFEVDLQTIVDLSMDRIASVNVLKDAASTAMYGSRAANGVLVVETVKPKPGKLQFTYNGTLTVDAPDLSDYNMMNAVEKLAFEKAAGFYDRQKIYEDWRNYQDLYNKRLALVQSGVDSYWLSEGLRTGFTHKHNIRAMGGNEAMYYSFGLNYSGNEGVMKQSGRDVLGANINLQYRIEKLQISNDFTFDYTESENAPVAFSEYARVNPYYRKEINPDHPEYLEIYSAAGYTYRRSNPLYNASLNYKNGTKSTGFRNNFRIEYRPVVGLRLSGKISIGKTDGKTEVFKSPYHADFLEKVQTERGSYTKSTTGSTSYNGDFSVSYGKVFRETHNLTVIGRWEFKSQKRLGDSFIAIGFPTDRIDNPAFAISYPEDGKPSYSESLGRSMNMMMTANYSYKERYLIDATIRRDGSSNFGANKLWTNTWSVGLAWNIHKENFAGDWADVLKIRTAIGNPGNNGQAYDTYLSYAYNTTYQNVFGLGAQLNSFGNRDLDWQKTRDITVGADVVLFNRRLSVTLDYYTKITDPLIIQIGVAPSTGKNDFITNLGRNTIKGLTIDLGVRVIDNREKDLTWSLSLNGYHETSRYSRIGNKLDKFNETLVSSSVYRYRDGGSSTSIWTVPSAGIDPMSGKEIYIRKDGSYTFTFNQNDEVICGNTAADLEGVIGTNLYWKGLSVNAYLRYGFGGDLFNSILFERIEKIGRYTDQYNQDKRAYYDRWKQPGDRSKFRDISDVSDGRMSSRYVQKNNFISGESFSVGYRFFGQDWLKKAGLSSLSVNASMNELFRCSTIKIERGTDYPFARTFSISLNASF